MNILNIELPDHLAELETITGVANEDLVRHWLDDLAGKFKLLRARALGSSWGDHEAWAKQCNLIVDALIDQLPEARKRWGEYRSTNVVIVPDHESIEEMKAGDARRRAEDYVQLPLQTGIRNAKIAAFLEGTIDEPHFAIPAGGRMRDAFKRQFEAVYWELIHGIYEIAEAIPEDDYANWCATVQGPREARINAQCKKLRQRLGMTWYIDDEAQAAE
jgi:hypothetical protein